MTDTDESLKTLLARSGTAPDYTMGALQTETGISPETLRSWENRHGFPTPSRTPSNHRLYSERDVVAVRWLLDQTTSGRGISTAIAILKRHLPDNGSVADDSTRSPLDHLVDALALPDLAAAQTRWDDLALGLSPRALGRALLSAHARGPFADRSGAFLLRKATVLLDDAGPDTGENPVAIVTSGMPGTLLPATIAAGALARSGCRILTPFPNTDSLAGLGAIRDFGPSHAILIGISARDATSLNSLLPDVRLQVWDPSTDSIDRLIELCPS